MIAFRRILVIVRQWQLLATILFATAVYLLFSHVPVLEPVGDRVGPFLTSLMPYIIFMMLYTSFCKIRLSELRLHTWHFIIQAIRASLSLLAVGLVFLIDDYTWKVVGIGIFICVVSPTAAASPVITEKLGGNLSSLTAFLVLGNLVTAVLIPLLFPMVNPGADMPFLQSAWMVLRKVSAVLLLPLMLAILTRLFLPRVADWFQHRKNLSFYLWCTNLSIITGVTWQNLLHSGVHGGVLIALLFIPLPVTLLLFTIGKAVGHHYGDSVTAGQALGQKNTSVAIWLTLQFLNPIAAIAPGAYIIWQNIVNAVQLHWKEKYGYLKW
mgnify:CR=1 FL=1